MSDALEGVVGSGQMSDEPVETTVWRLELEGMRLELVRWVINDGGVDPTLRGEMMGALFVPVRSLSRDLALGPRPSTLAKRMLPDVVRTRGGGSGEEVVSGALGRRGNQFMSQHIQ